MEVYRHLRTNIEYSSVDKKIHVINITSTQPGEEKQLLQIYQLFLRVNMDQFCYCDVKTTGSYVLILVIDLD